MAAFRVMVAVVATLWLDADFDDLQGATGRRSGGPKTAPKRPGALSLGMGIKCLVGNGQATPVPC